MSWEENEAASSQRAHAYTPGLKIKRSITMRKARLLPIMGEVTVDVGDTVNFDTIVARTTIQGDPVVVPASDPLGLNPDELPGFMVKNIGDEVEKDEVVAQYIAFFGLLKRFVRSPVDGTVEHVSSSTGRVTIRGKPIPLELKAYIPGKVVRVIPNEGVEIEANATFIQGIFGVGGESHGELTVLVDSPDEPLTTDMIAPEHKGKIIVGGSLAPLEALKRAVRMGVAGIVVGGVKGIDISDFIGYEIGVAITGHEEIGSTLVLTEGFGEIAMSERTFDLFRSLNGEAAAINGATQIRAGVQRPEIIILQDRWTAEPSAADIVAGMTPGTRIRVIRQPYFGEIGTVTALPVELQRLETGSHARVVEIELESGGRVLVPRANVEILEE